MLFQDCRRRRRYGTSRWMVLRGCAYGMSFFLFLSFYSSFSVLHLFLFAFLNDFLLISFFQKKNYRPTPNAPDSAPTPRLTTTNSHPASRCGATCRPSHRAAAAPPPRGNETDASWRTQTNNTRTTRGPWRLLSIRIPGRIRIQFPFPYRGIHMQRHGVCRACRRGRRG